MSTVLISNAEFIARTLGKAKGGRGKWTCLCPLHETPESRPSLSVRDIDGGKVFVTCHGGCNRMQVITELKRRWLWPRKGS